MPLGIPASEEQYLLCTTDSHTIHGAMFFNKVAVCLVSHPSICLVFFALATVSTPNLGRDEAATGGEKNSTEKGTGSSQEWLSYWTSCA